MNKQHFTNELIGNGGEIFHLYSFTLTDNIRTFTAQIRRLFP